MQLREFDDVDAIRGAIFNRVQDAVKTRFPMENERYRLEVANVGWDSDKPFTLDEQKKALLHRESLNRKLMGEWRLVDKATNQVIDKRAGVLAHVPYMTPRGTFIHNGTEYTVANQMRLKPAVYTRRKENQEVEAHFNALPGTGKAFRVFMEPETGVFKMHVGQANIPLYPVMRAIGVNDDEMGKWWGRDVLNANRGDRQDPQAVSKMYKRLVGGSAPAEQQAQAVAEALQRTQLDPDVVQRNLGSWLNTPGLKEAAAAGAPANVTPGLILATTRKLMDIWDNKADPDDRDSLANQTFHGPEDFFSERISKDAGGIARKILWQSTNRGKLVGVHSGALTPQVQGVLLNSGMGQSIEEINPMEMADQMFRVLRLGEGGIPSTDAIPDECYDEKTEVFTDAGWQAWTEVGNTTKFACLDPDTGRMEYRRPYRIVAKEYSGELYGVCTRTLDILVTPNHRHWVRKYRGSSSVAQCGEAEWEFELAADGHRKPRQFLITSLPEDEGHTAPVVFKATSATERGYEFDLMDWAELLGWYLSEGSIDSYALKVRSKYHITISQDAEYNPENVERIEALLTRMGITHSYQGHNFVFVSKQIGQYLQGCGVTHEKRVPESAFSWGAKQRKMLLDVLILGDGSEKDNGARVFHSTSKGLVSDVIRLATTLGIPSKSRKVRKHEDENHRDCYSCGLLTSSIQGVTSEKRYDDNYYVKLYDGWVYCAEVPGEKLLVRRNGSVPTWSGNSRNVQPSQFGYIDAWRGPESNKLGVDSRVTFDTYKGDDGNLYSNFVDVRSGKTVPVSARDAADKVLAFPGELAKGGRKVRAMVRGKLEFVDRKDVDYELPNISGMMNASVNLVPMSSATQGNRLLMAGKMFNQALPLREAEAPLVQSATPQPGISFEQLFGRKVGAVFAQKPGTVRQVKDNKITVAHDDGTKQDYELYNNFPLNRKTFIHNTPMVKAGDRVTPDQPMARSNFTDHRGELALGTNLRVAFTPYKGLTYEDAYVVSESAAKKMSSEHMYTPELELEKGVTPGYDKFISFFPSKYNKDQLATIDKTGVVKPGTVIKKGDPLILAVGAVPRKAAGQWTQIARRAESSTRDHTVEWDHDFEGVVTDVAPGKDGIQVAVRAFVPMKEGDKIAGRYGDKGTIARVVPDDQMPKDGQGRPFEVLQNPATLPSRLNPAQIFEMQLAKIARKTGKPVQVPANMEESMVDWVEKQLKLHNLKDTEDLEDPEIANRKIKDVLTGEKFFMKLHHTSESKWGARETGGYTSEGLPSSGGKEGAKTVANLGLNALLSHGACFLGSTNVLTELGWMEISKIVRERLAIKVASIDPRTGKVEYKRVVDWFCRSVPETELLKVETYARSGKRSSMRGARRAIRCTRGHEFLVPEGKTQAAYLKRGDVVLTVGTYAESWQYEAMLGTLMGDAYIAGRRDKAGGLAICHGYDQRWYLNWKFGLFRNFSVSEPKTQRLREGGFAKKPTSRFTLRNHPVFDRLRAMFYPKGKKIVPAGIVAEMGMRGLAIWFCDDGGCTRKSGAEAKATSFSLHTCGFTLAEVERLASELREYTSLPWKVYLKSGKYPVLHLTAGGHGGAALKRWAEMLAPYVPVKFSYKLGGWAEATGAAWNGLKAPEGYYAEPCYVKSVEAYRLQPYEDSLVYNITVEDNHTYVVHGIGVGNTEVLRDTKLVRGQKNEDFWRSFKLGYPPPTPQIPLVYKKFISYLRGAGINVAKDGDRLNLMAMTDKDVEKLSHGRVTTADTVEAKDLQPIAGGLFDRGLTGGHGGNNWTHIELAEPMPNPVMEEPIRRLLGLTQAQYEDVLRGTKELHGRTGGEAIKEALSRINVDTELERARADAKARTGAGRDAAIKKMRYLDMAKKNGLKPVDFVISKVPVVPPNFRPISRLKENMQVSSDANYLYQDLLFNDEAYRDMAKEMGRDNAGAERLNTYRALKAVTGLGDPVHPKLQEKGVAGLLQHVFGKGSPKFGMFQRRVIGTKTDVAGRAVITPNPSLDMDQVGLPEDQAWMSYKPFVIRRLVRKGLDATQAAKLVEDRDPRATEELLREMDVRPIVISRAPTLHKYGMMAAFPKLVKGHTLQISPLVTPGFNADFDGDSCSMDTRLLLRVGGLVVSMTGQEFMDEYLGGFGSKGRIWDLEGVEVPTAEGWVPARTFSVHPYSESLYRVVLENGTTFKVTGDHSLMVGGKEKKPTAVRRGEVLDTVCCPESGEIQTQHGWKRGYVDGYFVGDGSSTGRQVSYACMDFCLRRQLKKFIQEVTGWHVYESATHGYLNVSSSALASEMLSLFGRYADGKKLSDLVFNMESEYLWGFVFGLIDSDGSVERTASGSYLVRVWSISAELMRDFSFVLYRLGVPHALRYRNRGSKSEAWVVSIGKDGLQCLLPHMQHAGHKVQRMLEAELAYKNRKTKKNSLQVRGYAVKEIVKVPNEPWVFDIEADGTFAVENGVVVHNTMSYHVPISDKAVEEAADKMLPSKNLRSSREFDIHYLPRHEYQLGLYQASSKKGKKEAKRFLSVKDAIAAYKRGEIDLGDEVIIK